jgi:hypothetical protein
VRTDSAGRPEPGRLGYVGCQRTAPQYSSARVHADGHSIIAIFEALSERIFGPVNTPSPQEPQSSQPSEIGQARILDKRGSYKTRFVGDAIANDFRMLCEDLPASFLAHSLLELIV